MTVSGRLARTFRQGPVGSFPPLDESWIFSAAGDPICIVYPHPDPSDPKSAGIPRAGGPVRFAGTYLKTVRYAAGDGDRLAPLIVGDRPPAPSPPGEVVDAKSPTTKGAGDVLRAVGGGDHRPGRDRDAWTAGGGGAVGLALAIAAAFAIAAQHLRGLLLRRGADRRTRLRERESPDPPLNFVEPVRDIGRAIQPDPGPFRSNPGSDGTT